MGRALHSFVIPVFNEESNLRELYSRFQAGVARPVEAQGDAYELVFVDDGSSDRSREIIRELHAGNSSKVRLLALSRNFGHQIAISAGLDLAVGDTVTVLDADLQDPPEVILKMIARWREGFDVIYGVREKRKDESLFKKLTALAFYRMLRASTQLEIPLDAGDFRLMSRKAVEALKSLPERHRFMRGLSKWIGFKQASVTYVREARFSGETKYPLRKMVSLAWDAFTGFSLAPLRMAMWLGLTVAGLSCLILLWALYIRFFTDRSVQGWTSIMGTVVFLGGVQLFTIGVLGEYVGRIFEESKRRPLYFLDEVLGGEVLGGSPRVSHDRPDARA